MVLIIYFKKLIKRCKDEERNNPQTTVHNFGTKPSDKQFIRSTADIRVYYIWVEFLRCLLAAHTLINCISRAMVHEYANLDPPSGDKQFSASDLTNRCPFRKLMIIVVYGSYILN